MNIRSEKLLRLALDPAAATGEIANAAVAFVRTLRAEGVRPEDFLRAPRGEHHAENRHEWRFPFGKFKGRPLSHANSGYIEWLLEKLGKDLAPAFRTALIEELLTRAGVGGAR